MTRARRVAAGVAVGLALAGPAAGQSLDPGPPGPWVIDARGLVTGLPDGRFVLRPAADEARAAGRGLGVAVGGHVYPIAWGPARVGFGATVLWAGASASPPRLDADQATEPPAPVTTTRVRGVAPQVSFNFGTGDGWSYVSAGMGLARVAATLTQDGEETSATTGWGPALNYGGGARWFLGRHLAFGFDVRVHQFSARTVEGSAAALPRTTLTALTVGVSLR